MLRNIAFILFVLSGLSQARAQALRGTVLDPAGTPVANAQVELSDSMQVVFTSNGGEFAFDLVAPGRRGLSVRFGSFEPLQTSALVPTTGGIEVTLQFRQIQATASSIEVIGESSESALEKPGSLFIVTREELGQSHPMDANELLRRVPGLTLREGNGDGQRQQRGKARQPPVLPLHITDSRANAG